MKYPIKYSILELKVDGGPIHCYEEITKDLYYLLLSPKIFQITNRNDLFINKYALYLKKALTKKNNLSLKKVYSAWWQYEDNWLMNIDDNTLLKKKKNTISLRKTKQS